MQLSYCTLHHRYCLASLPVTVTPNTAALAMCSLTSPDAFCRALADRPATLATARPEMVSTVRHQVDRTEAVAAAGLTAEVEDSAASPLAPVSMQFRQPLPRTVSKALALAGVGAASTR